MDREKTGEKLLPGRQGGLRAAAKTYLSNARVNVSPVLFLCAKVAEASSFGSNQNIPLAILLEHGIFLIRIQDLLSGEIHGKVTKGLDTGRVDLSV